MGVSRVLDEEIWENINKTASKLEDMFEAHVVFYHGYIHDALLKDFRNFIEKVVSTNKKRRLVFFIHTSGGSVQACEKIVEIIRHHYEEVYFVVPDMAMSAGTILCMSGDKIYMDYSSSLGPIDPQVTVTSDGQLKFVPALGYLDMVDYFIEKSRENKLTDAEFSLLQNQDLALLRSYQQARDLSVQLLKDWLVKYKFKTWKTHQGTINPEKQGKEVTENDKNERATAIAQILGDNKIWHSHGRMIGIETLQKKLGIRIDDYSKDDNLREDIRKYADLLTDYIIRLQHQYYFHHHLYHN